QRRRPLSTQATIPPRLARKERSRHKSAAGSTPRPLTLCIGSSGPRSDRHDFGDALFAFVEIGFPDRDKVAEQLVDRAFLSLKPPSLGFLPIEVGESQRSEILKKRIQVSGSCVRYKQWSP